MTVRTQRPLPGSISRRALLAGAAAGLPRLAVAAAYPERPIRVIVPFAAGGTGDVVMRLLADAIEPRLGQPVIVEARPGAGGNLGAQAVAATAPDGYTLLLGATNNFVINQFLFRDMAFDPLAALAPITRVADVPSVLYGSLAGPGPTLREFLAFARARPGRLNYASPSVGTTPHLAVELLKQLTGIELVHVPYRGAPQAFQAVMTNEAQLYLGGVSVGREQIQARTVRALAVATEQRLALLPEVPTAAECGVAGYTASNWWGLAGPKGLPVPIRDRLHRAVSEALLGPDIRQRFEPLGLLPGGEPPDAFAASLRSEATTWSGTITAAGIRI